MNLQKEHGVKNQGLLRNVSSSMSMTGRVFFSAGRENGKMRELKTARDDMPDMVTPKFDKTNDTKQLVRRKNAGFIRSASARQHTPLTSQNNY